MRSISAVAYLTGISAHTLRAWEKRYGAVRPQRGAHGERLYTSSEVARLRLLATAVHQGHPISKLASLSSSSLRELIEESLSEGPPSHTRQLVERLKSAALSRRNEGLEDTLELCAAMLSPAALVEHVVAPFMEHLGEAWSGGVLAAARIPAITDSVQKLLLDRYGRLRRASRQPTIAFATLQGERHALGALGAALVAAAHGLSCFHLGADMSPHAIAEGAERAGASVIGLSLVAPGLYDCDHQLAELRNQLPEDVEIWLGGRERARPSALPANTLVLDGMQAFERQLEVRYQAADDTR